MKLKLKNVQYAKVMKKRHKRACPTLFCHNLTLVAQFSPIFDIKAPIEIQ
ncbi:MAG: hypothetical protein K1W01_12015 [Muribaculaceae bacterium]